MLKNANVLFFIGIVFSALGRLGPLAIFFALPIVMIWAPASACVYDKYNPYLQNVVRFMIVFMITAALSLIFFSPLYLVGIYIQLPGILLTMFVSPYILNKINNDKEMRD